MKSPDEVLVATIQLASSSNSSSWLNMDFNLFHFTPAEQEAAEETETS
jgi:hypothetical protein